MPLAFDAGVAQRGEIRDAVIAKLGPLKKSANPSMYIREIVTLPRTLRGEGDEKGVQMLFNALLGQCPGIALALGRIQFKSGGGAAVESDGELELVLYVASQHERSTTEGRLYPDAISASNNSADPGIFVMLQHVRELLAGQELGVESVNEMRAVEEDEVATLDNITVWEQRYLVTLDTTVNPARGVAQLLTSIEGNHSLDGIPDETEGLDPFVTTVTDIDPEDS